MGDTRLTELQMQMGMESCLGKTAMAGVMGGGLGAMFGLFMASVRCSSQKTLERSVRAMKD